MLRKPVLNTESSRVCVRSAGPGGRSEAAVQRKVHNLVASSEKKLAVGDQSVPVSEHINARAGHECVDGRFAGEALILIRAGEIAGNSQPAIVVVHDIPVPAVHAESRSGGRGDGPIGVTRTLFKFWGWS